jgi:hypothetical protein
LSVFAGKEAFNGYAAFLHGLGIVHFVEYYLLAAAVVHVVTAVYRSYTTKVRHLRRLSLF